MSNERNLVLASLLSAASLLWMQNGCSRKQDQVQAMQQKAEEAEKLDRQLQQAGTEQARKLSEAGLPAGLNTVNLSEAQKQALEERIRSEKGITSQALLQEILDKDKEIGQLKDRIDKLRAGLPKPVIARMEDRHIDLAMRFLKAQGVSDAAARRMTGNVALLDHLEPGNQVYHFLVNGQYGTWVTQGQASVAPTEVARRAHGQITGERDAALEKAARLDTQIADLLREKQGIEAEIQSLQGERLELKQQTEKLAALAVDQDAKLNSLHYQVGELGRLKEAGIIVVPVIGKDRLGPKATDASFDRDFSLKPDDLADGILIRASDAGVRRIRKVHVVPASLLKDQHYALTVSEDRSTATIRILAPDRFRNDKVVFAVSG